MVEFHTLQLQLAELVLVPGKVYGVLERMVHRIDERRIQEEQCSFRGTLNQLYTLSRVLEGVWEFAQLVYMCFIDLEKKFVPFGTQWGYSAGDNQRV